MADEFERAWLIDSTTTPVSTALAYEQKLIQGETRRGELFKRQLCWEASEELGLPRYLGFEGEFSSELPDELSDLVTERLMQTFRDGAAPVKFGGMLAVSGCGFIKTASFGLPGIVDTFVDERINLFGPVVAVGVTDYPYAGIDEIKATDNITDVNPEATKGIVALLGTPEVRGSDYGQLRPVALRLAVVPLAAEGLTFHALESRVVSA